MTPRLVLGRRGFRISTISFHALGLGLERVTVVRVMQSGSMNQTILLRAAVVTVALFVVVAIGRFLLSMVVGLCDRLVLREFYHAFAKFQERT